MTENIAQWVGIDVSKRHLDVYVRPQGLALRVDNKISEIVKLTEKLQSLKPELIVLEATGGMELDVAEHLSTAGLAVSIINPRQARDFGKATGKLAKTDAIDAQVLAHFGEAVRPRITMMMDEQGKKLQDLVTRRRQLVTMISAEKARLAGKKGEMKQDIQEHIDWSFSVSKEGEVLWGPTPLSHTSEGSIKGLKYEFPENGTYDLKFEVEGILFQPIPLEEVSFVVVVGEASAQPETPTETPPTGDNGGGCLIATAAYGSELSPQVQELRELRDNTILQTESGSAFMSTFNEFYYSFSPTIADIERENPIFKEGVKITLTPMLTSLSILNHVDIDSEEEMLGYGISLILLNVGMYAGIPVFGILKLYQFRKN